MPRSTVEYSEAIRPTRTVSRLFTGVLLVTLTVACVAGHHPQASPEEDWEREDVALGLSSPSPITAIERALQARERLGLDSTAVATLLNGEEYHLPDDQPWTAELVQAMLMDPEGHPDLAGVEAEVPWESAQPHAQPHATPPPMGDGHPSRGRYWDSMFIGCLVESLISLILNVVVR